jgi:hypothetical protein
MWRTGFAPGVTGCGGAPTVAAPVLTGLLE